MDVGHSGNWGIAKGKLHIKGCSLGRVRSRGAADERAAETLICLHACHTLKPLIFLS